MFAMILLANSGYNRAQRDVVVGRGLSGTQHQLLKFSKKVEGAPSQSSLVVIEPKGEE